MDPRTGENVAKYLLRYGSVLLGLMVLTGCRRKTACKAPIWLTLFQLAGLWRLRLAGILEKQILVCLGGLMGLNWILYLYDCYGKKNRFPELTQVFFLCTLSLLVLWEVRPGGLSRQLAAIFLGVAAYLVTEACLASPTRIRKLAPWAAGTALLLLGAALLGGKTAYGAKNWLQLGPLSFQPAEPAKVLYVLAGMGVPMGQRKGPQLLYLLFTLGICGLLGLMNDLGTAVIFLGAYFVITWGQWLPITGLAGATFGTAAFLGIQLAPHALRRLENWRQIWKTPFGAGFQQTQGLMCLASGGLLGLGPGFGRMGRVFAADSDMVFAALSEVWGLGMGLLAVGAILLLTACREEGDPIYLRGWCGAGAMLLVQTILNVLGAIDLLPMTGVTLPFVSGGGSSMVSCWCLVAFLQARREK